MDDIEDFRRLLEVTRLLSSTLNVDEQLPMIMDAAMALTSGDRAVLVLLDKSGDQVVRAERSEKKDTGKYSRSLCKEVIENGEPTFILDTDLHQSAKERDSMVALQLRTVMCAPLRSRTGTMGALYVHSTNPTRAFTKHKREIFVALSDHCAIALDNAQLYAASISDPMTGLYNHSYCMRRLDEEIARANRYGRYLALMIIDLDKFKHVNDTFGHRTGDKLLTKVADVLRHCTRNVDLPVRYGGDEFAIILPDTADPMTLANRVCTAVADIKVAGDDSAVSASIGVAMHPSDGRTEGKASDLIDRADSAMYVAKNSGGNRVEQNFPVSHIT